MFYHELTLSRRTIVVVSIIYKMRYMKIRQLEFMAERIMKLLFLRIKVEIREISSLLPTLNSDNKIEEDSRSSEKGKVVLITFT